RGQREECSLTQPTGQPRDRAEQRVGGQDVPVEEQMKVDDPEEEQNGLATEEAPRERLPAGASAVKADRQAGAEQDREQRDELLLEEEPGEQRDGPVGRVPAREPGVPPAGLREEEPADV